MTGYVMTRDGSLVTGRVHMNENALLGEFHRVAAAYSMSHALQHEGYGVLELDDVDVWDVDTARAQRDTARRLFRDHGHDGYDDDETRAACGACALEGYGAHDESGALSPNYAGWGRVYVQGGRRIPDEYGAGFLLELDDENTRYADCLARDVRTYGVSGVQVPAWIVTGDRS